jgi:hypothetical protein
MIATCFCCGSPAFATFKVEVAIGPTRLKITGEAGEAGICAACMIELADWVSDRKKSVLPIANSEPVTTAR